MDLGLRMNFSIDCDMFHLYVDASNACESIKELDLDLKMLLFILHFELHEVTPALFK